MQELGYVPNALARGLRSGQTRTIGLVVPDNTNPFFAEIARHIENLGFEKGFSVILCNSDYDLVKENAHVDVLLAKQVDGVIFCASGGATEARDKLRASKTPVVTIDHDISNLRNETVVRLQARRLSGDPALARPGASARRLYHGPTNLIVEHRAPCRVSRSALPGIKTRWPRPASKSTPG